jgi:nitrate reductase delta subunit
MAALYKVLSALLTYPTADLQEAAPDILAVLQEEHQLARASRDALKALATEIGQGDLLDLQMRYVDLFDRSRGLSLHLFEHVHGESRDRGQAMVTLRERYRAAGFDIAANELPDYLPLYLEFLSLRPGDEARAALAEANKVLHALADRLKNRDHGYAAVLDALADLSQEENNAAAPSTLVELDDPDDLVALDRAWEEAEVRFGPGDAQDGCPRASMIRKPTRTGAPA